MLTMVRVILKKLVSFSVNQDGVQRVFLRVEDRGEAGLLLLPVGTGSFEENSSSWDIRDFHFSVHPPKVGSGYTIKKTVSGSNKNQYESTAYFAKASDDGFRSIVFARTLHDIWRDKDNQVLLELDNIVICNRDIKDYTPYYVAIVSTDEFPLLKSMPIKITTKRFRFFKLHILSGLFCLPPMRGVETTSFITSRPWQGMSREKQFIIPDMMALSWTEEFERSHYLIKRLAFLVKRRFQRYRRQGKLGNISDEVENMILRCLMFSAENLIHEPV